MRRVEGYVLKLKCKACAAEFPTFTFFGDSDMLTAGLQAVTSINSYEVAIGEMSSDELLDKLVGAERFAQRISREFHKDFRFVRVIRYEGGRSDSTKSFAKFRRNYAPQSAVYSCLRCGGEAVETARLEPSDFKNGGGSLAILGQLTLATND